MKKIVFIAFVALIAIGTNAQTNRYVKPGASGNGLSWATASGNIQSMINASAAGDSVFVAKGNYNLGASLTMKEGVKIYGSFQGTETYLTDRTLSGDPAQRSILNGQNTRRVFNNTFTSGNPLTTASVLDGFSLINGYHGSGSGGAMYNEYASPVIANCIIANNEASGNGGGINLYNASSPLIINCLIYGNTANGVYGGGIMIQDPTSNPTLINCTITANEAFVVGGLHAINNTSPNPTIINCLIYGNSGSDASYTNTMPTVSYSLIGGFNSTANGNVNASTVGDVNNVFVNHAAGDYRLKPFYANKAVNKGNNTAIPDGVTTDIEGNNRIAYDTVDLGAYEVTYLFKSIYVDDDAAGTGDGSSWSNAFTRLEDAIDYANAQDTIFVAAGTYQPADGQYYTMKEGVKIYGGYPNGGGTRDWNANISVLQGNNNRVIRNVDNGLTNAAVLNGFTVTGGSFAAGAGMYNSNASPTVANCIFTGNEATGGTDGGGGMFNNHNSSPLIYNCLFVNNTATLKGGAIENSDNSNPQIINCTIAGNTAADGGGMFNKENPNPSNPVITNTVLYGNSTGILNGGASAPVISYSLVQGNNSTGNNNIDASAIGSIDEIFVNAAGSDYHLFPFTNNPAVNSGNNNAVSGYTTDLGGNNRITDGTVDMGAYELPAVVPAVIFVDGSVAVSGSGGSWATAFKTLQEALAIAVSGNEIRVAADTYQPNTNTWFALIDNVKIYGGYATGGSPARDWEANVTILKGNGSRVLRSENVTNETVLDGFTVRDGNINNIGGGMYNTNASPVVANCIFTNNQGTNGGAVYNNTGSSPVFTNCSFTNNTVINLTDGNGGAVYNNNNANPVFSDCSFTNNKSNNGGALYNSGGSTAFTNCAFISNIASTDEDDSFSQCRGGAVSNYSGTHTFTNCVFWKNELTTANNRYGAAMLNMSSANVTLTNCTMVKNTGANIGNSNAMYNQANVMIHNSVILSNAIFQYSGTLTRTYSLIQNFNTTANGNISASDITLNDIFADADNDDYRLKPLWSNPVVNKGNNAAIPEGVTTDLDGNDRIKYGTVDLGAYEARLPGSVYVDQNAVGNDDGSSWANAFLTLQQALDDVIANDTIYVAQGTYIPTVKAGDGTLERDRAFVLQKDVKIFGGYPTGGGTRDWAANPTILSGEIGDAESETDNCYHVVIGAGDIGTAELDGFTITKGFGNSAASITVNGESVGRSRGGLALIESPSVVINNCTFTDNSSTWGALHSLRASAIITNCTFTNNKGGQSGGGISVYGGGGTAILEIDNCTFINNTNNMSGGTAIYASGATLVTVSHCNITGNVANSGGGALNISNNTTFEISYTRIQGNSSTGTGTAGGLLLNDHATGTVINCIITGNRATGNGGGIYFGNIENVSVINTTIAGNNAASGGGVYKYSGAAPVFANTIIYGNSSGITNNVGDMPVVTYSNVQEGYTGDGNTSGDPLFVSLPAYGDVPFTSGDYHLQAGSVAFNTGDNAVIPEGVTTDLDGNARIKNGTVDMGAYELIVDFPLSFYVDDDQNGNGSSWANAFQTLQQALAVAESTDTIFVAEGTYQPASGESFIMKEGVKILGGYPNGGGERDWATHVTTLQGNNGRVISNNANGLTNAALLDGFTITGGSFAEGGGIYNNEASPTIANCIFTSNVATGATDGGGAMFNNHSSSPFIVNCIFDNNSATEGGGGMQNSDGSSPIVLNSLFESNESATMGAAIFNKDSNPVIVNCTIVQNDAPSGAGMRNSGSNPVIQNTIIFGNNSGIDNSTSAPVILYSLIQGISDTANGNIDATGLTEEDIFTDASSNNYTPVYAGPAYNTGNNPFYTDNGGNLSFDLDLAGLPRLYESNIDLGAYEAQSFCSSYTQWNGFSWSNGEPDSDKLVIITGDLTLNENLAACELMVGENGSLTIPDGFYFWVNNKIINNAAAADFVVASGGNLIQNENVENIGEITVIRESQPMIRLDYTLWSSPVISQNLFGFSPDTVNGVTNYSGSAGRIYIYDGANGYVNPDPFDENTIMDSGTGYLFRSPNNFDSTVPAIYNGVFTGVPFNGNLSVDTHADNYTSIGNPYPSNIYTDAFIFANPGISTLYFWNNNHSEGNNYAACVLNNCVAATGGGNIPDGVITVGQGFIVETTGSSVNFDNGVRVSNPGIFFKTDELESHRFWLNLSGDDGTQFNQILTGYMTGATNEIDNQIDGRLFGYEGSAIYNLIDDASTGSATKFTIQGRALPFETDDVVPLGFRADETGKFLVSIDHSDGLFAEGQKIYLKDNLLDTLHDLTESGYEFESEAGEFNSRFEIVYKNDETMDVDDFTKDDIRIYKNMDFIEINSKSSEIGSVEIYDLSGRRLFTKSGINEHLYRIRPAAKGVLIVKVQTQNGKIETKKIML